MTNPSHLCGTMARYLTADGETATVTMEQYRNADDLATENRLVDRFASGETFGIVFGGQGVAWLPGLAELAADAYLHDRLQEIVGDAERILAPLQDTLAIHRPEGFAPLDWIRGFDNDDEQLPSDASLTSAPLSIPGIVLTQVAVIASLQRQGFDLDEHTPVAVAAHSQGVLASAILAGAQASDIVALAQLIGAAGHVVAHRVGLVSTDRSAMLSVSRASHHRIAELLEEYVGTLASSGTPLPEVSMRNGRQSSVISGRPEQLAGFVRHLQRVAQHEADQRSRKETGGAALNPVCEDVDVTIAYHHPALAPAVEMVAGWASEVGLDARLARDLASAVLVEKVNWLNQIDDVVDSGATWVLDLGPGDVATRLTAPIIRGNGIGVIPAATRGGQRNLFTPGGIPEVPLPYSAYRPALVALPDGDVGVETSFTRLTGRSPILLAGMTPTTVDPAIVAAAANAGHWAELAGGGQVTEEIFADNLERLEQLLEPGCQAQFNALFLDPYLWRLQLGGQKLVQKARAAGAPIDGVVITAGIPELEQAVALVDELTTAGINYVAFKPGTVEQIRSVIRIAAELPSTPIIVQVEGGRAGGHHSWEDLDDLLIATYAELRERSNVVLCVGGGIGTPERAYEYLSGQWAVGHQQPIMPVDGILVGTAAMATQEATTIASVKELLVRTPGCEQWIGAGQSRDGMASGRSQLGADIHEIDNAASRCGRLLDEVAGDADAVAQRRAEVIAAMDLTAKPYFGDVAAMTYQQWLTRFANLTCDVSTDAPVQWRDASWADRWVELVRRAEARLHPDDRGEVDVAVTEEEARENPSAAVQKLVMAYPDAQTATVHPADVHFFVEVCRRPGKPVNFVPIIDKDVRRWWRSDSLWQAHDEQYDADQVCVIPGPVSVAGITRVDEPVGALLDRFESHIATALGQQGDEPVRVASRQRYDGAGKSAVATFLAAPTVDWAGRKVVNPVVSLGNNDRWLTNQKAAIAVHGPTGASVCVVDGGVELSVPVANSHIELTFDLDRSGGRVPALSIDHASAAMMSMLSIAVGGELIEPDGAGLVQSAARWTTEGRADHRLVTARATGSGVDGVVLPDSVVGSCWPAVFSAIATARTADGTAVIEGLLDLVHLDHAISLAAPVVGDLDVTITASVSDVTDSAVGRVVTVPVTVADQAGAVVAVLTERFAVRGRIGAAELEAPAAAGGTTPDAIDGTRKLLRRSEIRVPMDMRGFAQVTGDHNPIHTDGNAASLAGLVTPIAHGMWLSAVAQEVAGGDCSVMGWTARYLGMVRPGDTVSIRVDRIGIAAGNEVVEVAARVGESLVMVATAQLTAPPTVYAFPGQGIQKQGMGLDGRANSAAARQIWDRADRHTRKALGFSILAVVRDNPTTLHTPSGVYHHPDGVLHLTQFTQVAMATLGVAQVAQLREAGAFIDGAITCGHSVGEYNALAACVGVLPLEAVLEVVFQRGEAMHHLIPRDAQGRSEYRLAAIRPSQCGVADDEVVRFVASVADDTGEFLEVVNLNLRGSQYAVAGTVRGLKALEAEIERRRDLVNGKRAFIVIPGIDVPFHSSVLRDGVPEFRDRLRELLPETIDPKVLVGRYIPNLVPRLFSLKREFVQEIVELVPSEPLREVLANWDVAARDESALTRTILVELLAWQFASPVRWIETQDLLFAPEGRGGLGVRRFVEIGVSHAPTLSGLARNTLALDMFGDCDIAVLNCERDADVLCGRDTSVEPDDADEGAEPVVDETPAAQPEVAVAAAVSSKDRPADVKFTAAHAVRSIIALWTKVRLDQIGSADTIETLCDGVSSRRNQLLMDMGAELDLGAIDGAAEAPMSQLESSVEASARGYRPLGPVLDEAVGDQVRKVLGPEGKRVAYIDDRVSDVWQLGPGWAMQVRVAVALGTRDGQSVRGGDLGTLSAASVDELVDAAVSSVARDLGVVVYKPEAPTQAAADPAAVSALADKVIGNDGALATAARTILHKLGLDTADVAAHDDPDTDRAIIERVEQELGSEWVRFVTPRFDARKAVLLDDRWASARCDLAEMWLAPTEELGARFDELVARFVGAGSVIEQHASWWQGQALATGNTQHANLFGAIAHSAQEPSLGQYASDVAVVTGAGVDSIGAAVVGKLLAGGATVIATASRLDSARIDYFRELYRTHARYDAALWIVGANMASFADVDALVAWITEEQTDTAGGTTTLVKPALRPTLLFPFAAPPVMGDMSQAGASSERDMRVLLWSVERLIAGIGAAGADHAVGLRTHVVLPGSPNRGLFGGDGAYGESKAALDALVQRWSAEKAWSEQISLVHAIIGWVRGTGLMRHNDPMVAAVEAAGVRTWSTDEMADELLARCTADARAQASATPITADLTAGLTADTDLSALVPVAQEPETEPSRGETVAALPGPARVRPSVAPEWSSVATPLDQMVVIVGVGEVGPYGSSRTRFDVEVDGKLSAAGVAELAWTTGIIRWDDVPTPGWYDAETGDRVAEEDIADRYHDTVMDRCGIRDFGDDGALEGGSAPLLESVFLDDDLTFAVGNEAQARAFVSASPSTTRMFFDAHHQEWRVTRLAGSEIRVPRRIALSRTVGGQIPEGFDPTRWGVTADQAESVDRVALWNLVATVDAFVSSGFDPVELLGKVHPTAVANTQGTGMGGMTSMRSLYIDTLLGESKANDILQEALPNVIAAHVVQAYIGSYGAMIHPVAACATAAVSVEEGVDKIKVGKALFAVAGGFDDLGIEGIVGFGDMSATADTAAMHAKGIDSRYFSRANDRRRGGFVESQGGGTVLLARGDVAAQMGLPVLGVVAWAQSFGDGVHTSIPAPGLGALGAASGSAASPMAKSLAALGVRPDDIAVISKHDTSTNANDPNEADLHERIAGALGRSTGAPLFVVSQKTLTGHAKGGAAAFSLIGLCQVLREGVIPGNRSLDCVDPVMKKHPHLVWPTRALRAGDQFPLKAGLLTSLGFGHVSGLIAVVHPEAFVAALPEDLQLEYRRRAAERETAGVTRRLAAMCGGESLYQRPPDRRFDTDRPIADQEAAMLLDPQSRLGEGAVFG